MPGILGGLTIEQGSHNAIGASDSAIVPERLPPALRPASRCSNQALHRQHGDDILGEQVGIEVSGNHGRAAAHPTVVQTPWVRVGITSSTFGGRGGGEWSTIFRLWMEFRSIGGSGIQSTSSSWIGARWICSGRR
jgi:hypothetical protein